MAEFVHLHNHSDYSLLKGAAPIETMVQRASELGMKHLALTDDGNMFGALEFYQACTDAGINPIVGCDFYVAQRSRHSKSGTEDGFRNQRLVLLAKDQTGYRTLMMLASLAYTEGFYYKPRIDKELLEQYHEGLIALSGNLSGEIPTLIRRNRQEEAKQAAIWYRDLYGEGNFYLELMDHGIAEQRVVNRGLKEISEETGIPLVVANDTHYVYREDANAHDILLCIGNNKKKNDPSRFQFSTSEFYMKSPEEMAELFSDYPEALENTTRIAEKCNLEIELPGPRFPDFTIPEKFESDAAYLRYLTQRGLEERYGEVTETIQERAEHELGIVINMGFTGYFLIVWDFIRFAREEGIPVGPGRGSGASSVVAYALRITDIDPFTYDLLFERFLNPERVSMPDFDIDFCYERRGEVIEYVNEKYGRDKVGQIITFGTLKAKAVIRDVARVLDLSFEEADKISKLVPNNTKIKLKEAMQENPELAEVKERGGVHQELMEVSQKLEGLHRHASTHAAGIVIGQRELTHYVPLYRDPRTGSISTQYTMDVLEDCGLVKMDFLGLKTLTLIQHTEELIRSSRGIEFDIEQIPQDDETTFRMLGEGKSAAVFQFEGGGMQSTLKKAKPNSIKDLVALNALYRPGPMENIDQFVESKHGRMEIQYPLPELEPILEETYGVIVYQEQVMEIVQKVAGFSLGQADILRRAMGKKKQKVMEEMYELFVKGAKERGYSGEKADHIFDLLKPFAGYGFNKSHAVAYSVVAYKTAYLKANYPVEFMAANLTNEINNPDTFAWYMEETQAMGIEILPPDINVSTKYFTVSEGKVVFGLLGIKNVGTAAVDEIIREREENGPFDSFEGFLERVDLKSVNRKVLEMLIQAGIFDAFSENRRMLYENLPLYFDYAVKNKEQRRYGQVSLFGQQEAELGAAQLESYEDWSHAERLSYEKELLGYYFSGHPLDPYRERWRKTVSVDLSRPEQVSFEKQYNLLGMLKGVRIIQTKNGRPMAFATLEDFRGSMELVFFEDACSQYKDQLANDAVVGVTGTFDRRNERIQFLAEHIVEPEELEEKEAAEVHIRLDSSFDDTEELFQLRAFLFERGGSCPVFLHVGSNGSESIIKASDQLCISSKEQTLEDIREYPRVLEVWKIQRDASAGTPADTGGNATA